MTEMIHTCIRFGDIDNNASANGDDDDNHIFQEDFVKRRSGAEYRGEILEENYRPDGKGFKIFDGKSLYEGFFSNGMCHGIGRGINSKGEVYEGDFANDLMEGKGYYIWEDGRIYEGQFYRDLKHGQGTMKWPDGFVYNGPWYESVQHGKGTITDPEGHIEPCEFDRGVQKE